MLTARTYITLLVCAFTIGCHRLSPTEEKLVGTWEFTGLDATIRYHFNRDHTLEMPDTDSAGKSRVAARGTWQLDGDVLVMDYQIADWVSEGPPPRKTIKSRISEIEPDKIVFADGGTPFERVK